MDLSHFDLDFVKSFNIFYLNYLYYKKIYFLLFITFFCYPNVYLEYGKSWGRFGDNLLSYMHTKYVSYITGTQVLYTPFIYSDQLKLSDMEIVSKKIKGTKTQITEDYLKNNFEMVVNVKNNYGAANLILEIPYFPEDRYEYNRYKHINKQWMLFEVDWKDTAFKAILRNSIAPKYALKLLNIPKNKISIAIHVRDGGGFDDADAYLNNPLKFPPLEYYVQALEKIIAFLGAHREYYAYIFTDHANPKKLLDYFMEKFSHISIEFDCRLNNNRHDQNVLEDFFSLTLFNCLIRSQSNFSLTAAKIADYMIEIEPVEFKINGGHVQITKIHTLFGEVSLNLL